ncbi:hypothetical protein [Flaviaesturariibacter amylovorans]|uniref:Uncharacterized protein n=1 Tax=Flaviaesturariibacter amylovorans TaxID=1084520 RepID=A0ABP8GGN5_9BACT
MTERTTGAPEPLPPVDQPKLSDFEEQKNANPKANENIPAGGDEGSGDMNGSEITDGAAS